MKNFLFVVLFLFVSVSAFAQGGRVEYQIDNMAKGVTRDSLRLIEKYYVENTFLTHKYGYEENNKIQQLRMKARNVKVLGVSAAICVLGVNAFLVTEKEWSMWIDIPCATVIAIGTVVPFGIWANRLEERADMLEEQHMYSLSIQNNMNLEIIKFVDNTDACRDAIGLSVSVKF